MNGSRRKYVDTKMSIMFNEICINEEMMPKYTYICVCVCGKYSIIVSMMSVFLISIVNFKPKLNSSDSKMESFKVYIIIIIIDVI